MDFNAQRIGRLNASQIVVVGVVELRVHIRMDRDTALEQNRTANKHEGPHF
jgi:hypothetical protein